MLVFQDFAISIASFLDHTLWRKFAFCAKRTAKIGNDFYLTNVGFKIFQKFRRRGCLRFEIFNFLWIKFLQK